MDMGIISLVSIAVNAFTAVLAPFIARKLSNQQQRLRGAEETMDLVGAGLRVVERAVEENKDALARSGAGDRIAQTVRTYGPAARQLVDAARSAARNLRVEAVEAYEQEVIRSERAERLALQRKRASEE